VKIIEIYIYLKKKILAKIFIWTAGNGERGEGGRRSARKDSIGE